MESNQIKDNFTQYDDDVDFIYIEFNDGQSPVEIKDVSIFEVNGKEVKLIEEGDIFIKRIFLEDRAGNQYTIEESIDKKYIFVKNPPELSVNTGKIYKSDEKLLINIKDDSGKLKINTLRLQKLENNIDQIIFENIPQKLGTSIFEEKILNNISDQNDKTFILSIWEVL